MQAQAPTGLDVIGLVSTIGELTEGNVPFALAFRQHAEAFLEEHGCLEAVQQKRAREEERLRVVRGAATASVAVALSIAIVTILEELGEPSAILAILAATIAAPLAESGVVAFNSAIERGEWPSPPPEQRSELTELEDQPGADTAAAAAARLAGLGKKPGPAAGLIKKVKGGVRRPLRSPRGVLPAPPSALQSLTISERSRLLTAILNDGESAESPAASARRHTPPRGQRGQGSMSNALNAGAPSRRRSKYRASQSHIGSPLAGQGPRASRFSINPVNVDRFSERRGSGEEPTPLQQLAIAMQSKFGETGGFEFQQRGKEFLRPHFQRALTDVARLLCIWRLRMARQV
eukprot:Hpha_TRINITY_DN11542_c0_g1::TRINITY_DN11542_c0_g1_i1::g.32353::m.32353